MADMNLRETNEVLSADDAEYANEHIQHELHQVYGDVYWAEGNIAPVAFFFDHASPTYFVDKTGNKYIRVYLSLDTPA